VGNTGFLFSPENAGLDPLHFLLIVSLVGLGTSC
jgi:hypothetical protein